MRWARFLVLCFVTWTSVIYGKEPVGSFVGNIIHYVPNTFPKTPEDVERYRLYHASDFEYCVANAHNESAMARALEEACDDKEEKGKKEESLEENKEESASEKTLEESAEGAEKEENAPKKAKKRKKIFTLRRGYTGKCFITNRARKREEGYDLSPIIQLIQNEGFARNSKDSQTLFVKHMRLCFLLNRMESLDEEYNDIEYFANRNLTGFSVRHTLWRPTWMHKDKDNSFTVASFDDVRTYYQKLCNQDLEKAQAFLYLNEHQHLNGSVPYRGLRDSLRRSPVTRESVKALREMHPDAPVYFAMIDSDAVSFRVRTSVGTYSHYRKAIRDYYKECGRYPTFLTSGYSVPFHNNEDAAVSFGVDLDLSTRRAMASVFPLAPYYPEPNAIFLIPQKRHTLQESFFKQNTQEEFSPMETPTLINNIIHTRFGGSRAKASKRSVFLTKGEIETTIPDRFLRHKTKNKQGEARKKEFPMPKNDGFKALSAQNMKDIRGICQSHMFPRDWAGYIWGALVEHKRDKVTLGAHTFKRPKNFFVSVASNIYCAMSPVAIFINLEKRAQNYNNFVAFMCCAYENVENIYAQHVRYTYGQDSKANTSAKEVRTALFAKYNALKSAKNLLNLFFDDTSCGSKIVRCMRACGESEVETSRHYIQKIAVFSPQLPLLFAQLSLEETKNESSTDTSASEDSNTDTSTSEGENIDASPFYDASDVSSDIDDSASSRMDDMHTQMPLSKMSRALLCSSKAKGHKHTNDAKKSISKMASAMARLSLQPENNDSGNDFENTSQIQKQIRSDAPRAIIKKKRRMPRVSQ